MDLRCAPCTDQHITDGDDNDDHIAEAITIVPILQTFTVGGQQIAAPVATPICYQCRRKQLGMVSKTGLVTA